MTEKKASTIKYVFCTIFALVLIASCSLTAFAASVPTYIVNEADRVAAKVNALQNDNTFTIMSFSDFHYDVSEQSHKAAESAGKAASLICDKADIDMMAMFGDYICGSDNSTKAASVKEFNAIHGIMADAASKVTSLWLRGNHDQLLNNQSSFTASFTDDDMYEYIGKYNKKADAGTGHRGEYGYVDFDAKGIRVIYLNTSDDSEDVSNHDLAKKNFMTQTQLDWFHSALESTKPDYDIVVLSHIPFYNGLYSWGRDIISTVDSYNTKQNSAGKTGNVIALINGHTHNYSCSATPKGIPIITVPPVCTERYNEYATSEWAVYREWGEYNGNDPLKSEPVYRYKTMGTAEDTSFNVIVIDRENHKINAINYGIGIDREFTYTDGNDGYQPDGSTNGFVKDENGWRYFQNNMIVKGFYKVDGVIHYFDKDTGYAPLGSTAVINGITYSFVGEKGECLGGWYESAGNRKRFYYSDNYYKSGFYEVNGIMYYFDDNGYALTGTNVVRKNNSIIGAYEFDGNGKFIGVISGHFVDAGTGVPYFADNGNLIKNKLCYDGVYYYYAGPDYSLYASTTRNLSTSQTEGKIDAGEYEFAADGRILILNGAYPDKYNSSFLVFYLNGKRIYTEGLYEYNGDYYYVRPNGLLLTWGMKITKMGTTGMPAGEYLFGSDGKMNKLNGPQPDPYSNIYLNFYIDGIRVYEEGLYEYNNDYYYVRSNGLLLTWGMRINKMGTTGMPAGEYMFGTDGKLQKLNGPQPDPYSKDYLNFYIDGIRIYEEGLYEYKNDYYYVRSNGLLLTWGMRITKMGTTGMPAGEYMFGTDGKLQKLDGPQPDPYSRDYLNFYIDGIRIYKEGLYEYNNDYYYVRSNGLLLTWGMRINKMGTTGMPAGEYMFGADGKMQKLNGPQPDPYSPSYIVFYLDGIRIYKEGLYMYNGDYYYVRPNGLLLTWGMTITEMGTTGLKSGYYEFGKDGKMIINK